MRISELYSDRLLSEICEVFPGQDAGNDILPTRESRDPIDLGADLRSRPTVGDLRGSALRKCVRRGPYGTKHLRNLRFPTKLTVYLPASANHDLTFWIPLFFWKSRTSIDFFELCVIRMSSREFWTSCSIKNEGFGKQSLQNDIVLGVMGGPLKFLLVLCANSGQFNATAAISNSI